MSELIGSHCGMICHSQYVTCEIDILKLSFQQFLADLTMKDIHMCKNSKNVSMEDCVHIASVGNNDKLFEIWCSVATEQIMFR